jgi:hypothetical protein
MLGNTPDRRHPTIAVLLSLAGKACEYSWIGRATSLRRWTSTAYNMIAVDGARVAAAY